MIIFGVIIIRVLLTSVLKVFFKNTQLKNYSLKRLNISIFDALNTQVSIKTYYLKYLKSAFRALVNISLIINNVIATNSNTK